jgi:hypothetical protein
MPARAADGDFRRDYSGVGAAPPSTAAGCGCKVTGPWGCVAGQQSQAHGGQVSPGAQAGQAQAQPPPPEPLPASTGRTSFSCAHDPVGHGVVMHSMLSEVQRHASVVSPVQELTSVCAAQGSAGGVVPQPQGAQAAPAGQAGQPQTATGADPLLPETVPDPDAPPEPEAGVVVVVAAPLLHAQLQAGQASPAGHSGQLQVQVPGPPPVPVAPPLPVAPPDPVPPVPPVVPPQPPLGWPQAQSQAGQDAPAGQAGQSQVQMPPPPAPPVAGGGQSHWTDGHGPSAGQKNGCTQRHVLPASPRSKQNPPPLQSWPSGQSAGAVGVPAIADQAQLVSAWQAAAVVRLAQGLAVTHAPTLLEPARLTFAFTQAHPWSAAVWHCAMS